MPRVVCVAEKNSIAKAVAGILSGGRCSRRDSPNKYIKNYDFTFSFGFSGSSSVTMTSVAGHLTGLDLDQAHGWGKCPIPQVFDAPIVDTRTKDQQKIADNIKKECRNADYLMIWTDCDREGEYIGWEIVQTAIQANQSLQANVYRAVFSHLESGHIMHAARNPKRLDQRAVDAVRTRMEVDLRSGVAFTRFLTELLGSTVGRDSGSKNDQRPIISYGTCQFPTLGFVVDRFERIRKFVPEKFWFIQISIPNDSEKTVFQWERGHLFDRLAVAVIYELCLEASGNIAKVADLKSKPTTKWRPLPLTTVELQKNCSRFLKMSAKTSLDAAEKLYQKGYISYPRTETDIFPPNMDLQALVQQQTNDRRWGEYAQNLLNGNGPNCFKWPRAGKNDDKAHPPIHPIVSCGEGLDNENEKKVYEYVTRHFLACCSEDSKGHSTTMVLHWGPEAFTANGIVVLERNFLDVYLWMKWETTKQLPNLNVGQEVELLTYLMKDGQTSPPNQMTESELILLMDANGIGTDATIAEHIEKIQQRDYIKKKKVNKQTYLIPTTLGISLVHGFEAIGLEDSFAKPFLRREMELDLKLICSGNKNRADVVKDLINKYQNYYGLTSTKQVKLIETYTNIKSVM
ncbi:DNA topoisomerase 3 [Lachancea thermotolerans CBS 6340]|uniref:DNA topoisomerase n=1 Tax=Lachancea thermotolerans (strain ATCC 56472 / CBS 6340 / NRRL Y-8284) TaxID=559295 RepID=C5DKW7_LACTC|nr:KLTH0F08118p [Lachancea thermotolerans CBS 6340]CAR24118.1 KLTH0F08118p [Lachancea thermotolerans CBS 6340]